ncbi:S41 family peptidase [Paenibacillus thalictri]|uniref:PDZ domain-containing protein n=1 Tax=Paenibacillus thalictri TaxID=2527873 RepID=A0A4Q9DTF6_9BACL|nr:S41 family peptidase [Paenibacillus thalictri]TBL80188.1 PDZ domain-containing protein [Paenibacillus thalictri]
MKKLTMASRLKKSVSAAIVLMMLTPFSAFAADANATSSSADQVKEILDMLQQNHVSAPSADNLSTAAIKGMVDSLKDPYTVYFTKNEWQQFTDSLEQNYVGIGVRVGEDKDGILIVQVFGGSSAEAAGIKRGDIITKVEGAATAGKKLDDVISTILGTAGTEVNLTIKRGDSSFDVKTTRKQVQIPVVTSHMFANGVGYINVSSFSAEADELFASNLDTLKQQGLKTLLIDLRNNPGGLLDSALNISKLFIKEGVLIHTKDRDNVDDPVLIQGGATQPFPVVMLVDEYSASASEVLTGALQDYNHVKVVGTKTFGKGSVQSVYPLANGGALKVTIEEYLTPNMRKVNKVGLTPDIESQGEVPQLITALRTAGLTSFTLEQNRRNTSLNSYELNDSFNIVSQNGRTYIPSRVLAALVGADVSWNEADKSVVVAAGDISAAFSTAESGDSLNQEGTSFIDVSKFADTFKQLKWSQDGGVLKLSVQ